MSTESLVFNGINGATGEYLLEATPEEISAVVKGEKVEKDHADELKKRQGANVVSFKLLEQDLKNLKKRQVPEEVLDTLQQLKGQEFSKKKLFLEALKTHVSAEHMEQYQEIILETAKKDVRGVIEGVDPNKLDEAGWGVIFAQNADPAIKDALQELLDLRKEQTGKYYREYSGDKGYDAAKQESKRDFLTRHGAGPGPADPEKVPYYLLIVGDPETIPYQFQYQLDVQYAVGRIHFDSPAEYKQYARSVVEAEKRGSFLPRQAAFFGVQNQDDRATALSAEHLVKPLAEYIAKDQADWAVQTFLAENAKKAQLGQLLGGDQTPAFLFTASHGMGFPQDDDRQLRDQGALLCQDWPGPKAHQEAIPKEHYFSADDVAGDAGLLGLLAFHFACFGAGTPRMDDFAHRTGKRAAIAPHAFIARLPQQLLSHPAGGALAVVGHVERAWGYSFLWDGAGAQLAVFKSALKRLLEGHTIGSALEYFNQRYAELSTELTPMLEDMKFGKKINPLDLAGMWTANNDARSYVIIGDPAVRLPVSENTTMNEPRPKLESITVESQPPSSSKTASPSPANEELGAAATALGLFDSLDDTKAKLTGALQQFSEKLGQMLAKAVDDVSTLEVATYASDDMSDVKYDFQKGEFTGNAKLRAVSRINLDGDAKICVPEKDGKVDEALWAIHNEMVKQAQTQRAELLKTLISTATGVIDFLKGL